MNTTWTNRLSFSTNNVHPTVVKQQYDTHNVWHFENQWRAKLFGCKPMSRCKLSRQNEFIEYICSLVCQGCYACFCPCCLGCQLAKHLGETSIIGCCPCSVQYFRTKLRTARRIEVCSTNDYCSTRIDTYRWIALLGFMLWRLLCIELLSSMYIDTNRQWIRITRLMEWIEKATDPSTWSTSFEQLQQL
jgi:hypothetical protein